MEDTVNWDTERATDSLDSSKDSEINITMNNNTDNSKNITFKEMDNTSIKYSSEKTEKIYSLIDELSKEDIRKMHIIENLWREREDFKRKLGNEDKIIQNLLVKVTELGEDIKKIEIRDLTEKIIKIQAEIEKLENGNKALRQKTNSEGNGIEGNGEMTMGVLGGRDIKKYKEMTKNETKNTSHQKNKSKSKEYKGRYYNWKETECKIHGNHKAGACRVACGFCYQRGSHRGEECKQKIQKISKFVENKIQKYGVIAKITAESYIKSNGILHVKEDFEKKWKKESGNQENRLYKNNNRNRKGHQTKGEVNLQEEDKMETLEQINKETSQKMIPRDFF